MDLPKRQAEPAMGHCGVTGGPGVCSVDLQGAWVLNETESSSLSKARTACVRRCTACSNCNWVSYSIAHKDCSWYFACEPSRLVLESPVAKSFRTVMVRATDHVAASGYCERTQSPRAATQATVYSPESWTCNAGFSGDWSLSREETLSLSSAQAACVQRCRACQRCRYVSYSRTHRDCSWFARCDLARLHQKPEGFHTLAVKPPPAEQADCGLPLPNGGVLPTSELLDHFVIIPSSRVVLCTIDKKANTLLVYLAAALAGHDSSDFQQLDQMRDHTHTAMRYRAESRFDQRLQDAMDPRNHWRRAVVWRDPIERFVSAYLDKCDCDPHANDDGHQGQERGTCGDYNCHTALGGLDRHRHWSIDEIAERVVARAQSHLLTNAHWLPQSRFCGGLGATWQSYTDVIPFRELSAGLATLLHDRLPPAGHPVRERVDALLNGSAHPWSVFGHLARPGRPRPSQRAGGGQASTSHHSRRQDEHISNASRHMDILGPGTRRALERLYEDDLAMVEAMRTSAPPPRAGRTLPRPCDLA